MEQNADRYQQLVNIYEDLITQLIVQVPSIVGAIALVVFGWFVALFIQKLALKLFMLTDQFVLKHVADASSNQRLMSKPAVTTASKLLFWIVFLVFLTAASKLLGWMFIAEWMNQLFTFMPKVLSALLVVFVGIFAANIVQSMLEQSLSGPNRTLIVKSVYVILLLVTSIVAIEQLGINIHFITTLITVFLALLLAGLVLGFSFGAKDTAANIIAMPYLSRQYKIGDIIRIADIEGVLVDFTQTTVLIENEEGRLAIPARLFQSSVSILKNNNEQG